MGVERDREHVSSRETLIMKDAPELRSTLDQKAWTSQAVMVAGQETGARDRGSRGEWEDAKSENKAQTKIELGQVYSRPMPLNGPCHSAQSSIPSASTIRTILNEYNPCYWSLYCPATPCPARRLRFTAFFTSPRSASISLSFSPARAWIALPSVSPPVGPTPLGRFRPFAPHPPGPPA